MPLLNASPLALPGGADVDHAWQELVTGPDPAVGANFVRIVPGETYEQLLSANFVILTNGAAGTRVALVSLRGPDNNQFGAYPSTFSQGASSTHTYIANMNNGQTFDTTQGLHLIGGQPALLLPGYRIVLQAIGLDPGDRVTQVELLLLRIPTGRVQSPRDETVATPLQV
jgi:hypothetical protein